jgi:hypothetical protein
MYNSSLGTGNSSAAVVGNKIQVQINWDSAAVERLDEYDMQTKELITRKWRTSNALGKQRSWEYEIGEEAGRNKSDSTVADGGGASVTVDLFVSRSNPVFMRRDQPRAFVFRVSNLPYPRDVYQISLDEEKQQIVLRTTNKKYFKRFDLPALRRLELPLETRALTYDYDASTKVLIMRYEKPKQVIQHEMEERSRHLSKVATGEQKEASPDCKTQ